MFVKLIEIKFYRVNKNDLAIAVKKLLQHYFSSKIKICFFIKFIVMQRF